MFGFMAKKDIRKIGEIFILSRISYFTIACIMLFAGFFLRNLTDVNEVFLTSAASTEGYNISSSDTRDSSIVQSEYGESEDVPSKYGNSGVDKIFSKYDDLYNDIQNYVKSYTGTYGIYFCNMTTGEQFGINDEEAFKTASTFKVPMNLCLFRKIQSGEINPLAKMTYLKKDYQEGTGMIQYSDFKTKYSVRDLAKFSITKSDNVAASMIIRLLGKDTITDYMKSVGGKVSVSDDDNASSPADMGKYMMEVYKFYKEGGELGKELMDNLINTDFNDRLPTLLPNSIKVAHKIGTQVNVVNDVGIVFTQKPYIISVMSKDVSDDQAPGVIANISKMVYDFEIANQEDKK